MENKDIVELGKDNAPIHLQYYEDEIVKTDKISDDINPILFGLYGEVGSIMTTSKKYHREKNAYPGFRDAVEEELGDAFWYFSALCRRLNFKLTDIFDLATTKYQSKTISANSQPNSPISQAISLHQPNNLDIALIELGHMTAHLLKADINSTDFHKLLVEFAYLYLQTIQSTELSFAKIVKGNLIKALGRFSDPSADSLPDFDALFSEEEQIPREFEIHITQRKSGQSYLMWKGVFIGSPLTDNIRNPDGYRFHDVFHFAHAAVLHWSPTFRALIKQKRKSDPVFDEAQDGGRAIVVEEGLTAWLFSYSKGLNYFDGHNGVSFDALKTIQKFVHGYEVEQCPLKLWEDAILQGYSVFREVRKNNGGVIIGNRTDRKISYRPIGDADEN